MSTFDGEETSSTSPPNPDYGDLCDLAVQLTLALLDSDVFKHASNHLISTVPAVAFVRFLHNRSTFTDMVTVQPGGIMERECYLQSHPPGTDLAEAHQSLNATTTREEQGPVPYPDSYWQAVKHQYGAASIYTAQMQSKGTSVGTLTVGSVSPNAFAGRRWAETIDIVGAMVAPYLHISDFRQQLGLKQKCLVDCLPAKVASHMLERRSMGMTPVMQPVDFCWDHGQASSSEDNESSTI
ncbi:g1908 [Coccomyxa elongata]